MDFIITKNKNNQKDNTPSKDVDYVKLSFLVLVVASSVFFFRFIALSEDLIYIIQFGTIGLLALIIIFQIIYWNYSLGRHHFTAPVVFVFLGVFLSMIAAYAFHNQPVYVSLWAQRFMYFYLLYFVLHIIQPSVKMLENILFFAGIIYAGVFLVQYFAYPTMLFDVRQGVERGTIRIFIPGLTIMYLAYFLGLTRLIFNNELKYIPYLLVFLIIYILTGTRSVIAPPAAITILIMMFSNKIKSRGLILILILALLGVTYYMFQDIIENLISLSVGQREASGENIRIRAARFFLGDFVPNEIAYITGNGEGHQASPYGMKIWSYKVNYGYFQSDIGIIGEYSKYGLFFILGVILFLFKGVFQRLETDYQYIRYFFVLLAISMPLSMNFTEPYSIVTICMLAYILDVQKNKRQEGEKKKKPRVFFPELEKQKQGFIKDK